jgi:hypothetical protein
MRAPRILACAALCASAWVALSVARAEERASSEPESAEDAVPWPTVDPSDGASPSGVTEAAAGEVEGSGSAQALPPRKTLWDFVKILPIFLYTPETSFGFGAGMLFQFDLPGAAGGKRPSSISLGAVYTLHSQILGQITPELRFHNDDYVLKLDLVGARYPNRFYGIGNEPSNDVYDNYVDCYFRGEADLRMRPFGVGRRLRPLFVGVHATGAWNDMHSARPNEPKMKSVFASVHDRGEQAVVATGLGPTLAWDSRDSINWPNRGTFAEGKFTLFEPAFGGDIRYRRLAIDLRQYVPTWLGQVLALRVVAQAVWGEVPFQRLPQLGGASLFRGWYGGQLRERMLMAAEAEYRVPISPRWAVVAFGSVGRVAHDVKRFDMRELHGAGGGGLRFSVDKRDRVNVRLDLAYGDGFYPYLQFREAF